MREEAALQQALSIYGLEHACTRLLQGLWNHVYHVESDDGKQFSLRICSVAYRDKPSLADELIWLAHVSSHGQVVVPRPIANLQGNLLTVLSTTEGERFCCLFAWIEGEEAYKRLTLDVMHQIGRALATLHQIAKEFDFPDNENRFRNNYRFDRTLVASHREWIAVHQAEIGQKMSICYTLQSVGCWRFSSRSGKRVRILALSMLTCI